MNAGAPPRWSLRTRLLALLIVLVALLFGVGAVLGYDAQRRASQDLIDASLRESGRLLLQLAQHEIEEHGLSLGVALLKAETQPGPYQFRYQIWSEGLHTAFRSADLPAAPLVDVAADGFGWSRVDGETWRTYAAWNAARSLQIQIAQPDRLRRDLDARALRQTALVVLVLLAVGLAFVWWVVDTALQPLRRAAADVEMRSAADLRPVAIADAPRELAPILDSLNSLLRRFEGALAAERRFTSDAAHELRTPLAAIRTNAQVLLGSRGEAERAEHGADLLASVDRGTRLVEQLLSLARADAQESAGTPHESVDLAALARRQLQAHASAAVRAGVALRADLAPARVDGVPALLEVLLRNLLDNALRYSPAGGQIRFECGTEQGEVRVAVTDQGPGIPVAERERVFERFYRLPDAVADGSGLGLSIVRRIAELHRARIALDDGPDGVGTRVTLRFPAASAAEE